MEVANSTISGNTAPQSGGAIHNTATLIVGNSTISGNSAGLSGGGIANEILSGQATIVSSTITDNIANSSDEDRGSGGGIFNAVGPFGANPPVIIQNTIVAANVNGSTRVSDDIFGSVDTDNSVNNLIGVATGIDGLQHDTNGNQVGIPALPVDPVLGPLQYNGGFATNTHARLAGSPALDQGNSRIGTARNDQRGGERVTDLADIANSGDGLDVGALESLGAADQSLIKLDIDGDSTAQPLSGGLLAIRAFAGDALVSDAANPDGDRPDTDSVQMWIDSIQVDLLDIDGDGQILPLNDGILIVRFLAGFTGNTLANGVVNPEGTRTDPAEILAHLQTLFPSSPSNSAIPRSNASNARHVVPVADGGRNADPESQRTQSPATVPFGGHEQSRKSSSSINSSPAPDVQPSVTRIFHPSERILDSLFSKTDQRASLLDLI